jgi:AraC family transcriptional activator of mtrCDE
MPGLADTGVDAPLVRISPANLNAQMTTLEVRVVQLSECLIAPGWGLEPQALNAPGIHCNPLGKGSVAFNRPRDETADV